MNIFGRTIQKLRSLAGLSKEDVERAQIEAIRERRRSEDQLAAIGKLTAEARLRGAAAARLHRDAEVARERSRLEALARQERIAKENLIAAQRQEIAARDALIRLEKTKTLARDVLLRGRQDADEELFKRTFGYDRPKSATVDENQKSGEGGLPDQAQFLKGYIYSAFASSNVDALQYDPIEKNLHVSYLRRSKSSEWYCYHGVSKALAIVGYQSASKGIFVHDLLRGRRGKRLDFERGVAPPSYLPITERSSSAEAFAGMGGF